MGRKETPGRVTQLPRLEYTYTEAVHPDQIEPEYPRVAIFTLAWTSLKRVLPGRQRNASGEYASYTERRHEKRYEGREPWAVTSARVYAAITRTHRMQTSGINRVPRAYVATPLMSSEGISHVPNTTTGKGTLFVATPAEHVKTLFPREAEELSDEKQYYVGFYKKFLRSGNVVTRRNDVPKPDVKEGYQEIGIILSQAQWDSSKHRLAPAPIAERTIAHHEAYANPAFMEALSITAKGVEAFVEDVERNRTRQLHSLET